MRHSVIIIAFAVFLTSVSWAQKQPFPIKGGIKVVPGALGKNIAIGRAPAPNAVKAPRFNFTKQLKEEHIQLKDGDVFRGKFSHYTTPQGVHWKHPHISPQLIFNPKHVKHIQFEAEKKTEVRKLHSAKITLFSGDVFSGDLKHMSEGKLVIDTWYAGRIEIEQSAIMSVIPSFISLKTIYEGPKNVNDWSFYDPSSGQVFKMLGENPKEQDMAERQKKINLAHGTWKLKNDTFETSTSQSRVGRRFEKLPDKIKFDFDLDWSSYLNLYINFLSDRLDSYSSGNSYCLRLNASYAYLYKYSLRNGVGGGRSMGANVRVNLNSLGNHARISIRTDRKKGAIALYINDKFLQKWEDTQKGGPTIDAKCLLFTSMSSNLIELSRIRVSEWSGNLPDGNKVITENGTEDFLLFANEDSMTGKLIGIEGGKIKFKTAFAELPIPLQTITRINMARKNNETTVGKGPINGVLHNGHGQISGAIQSWKNEKIVLSSPYFSDTSFNQNAFERIEFDN